MAAHAERRARTPGETRTKLLEAAFEQIFRHGFQAASLNAILSTAGVTKGAMYHHFADKAELGRAVVDEVVRAPILAAYLQPLQDADDPLSALQEVIRRRADDFTDESVALGCPLNNLAQEMSPLDERFRARVEAALQAWIEGFADALGRARDLGVARADVDARGVASFLVATIEGSFGMAKNARSVTVLRSNLETLADYLETLRA